MINCLIIDDEQSAINLITTYVSKVSYLALIDTATDPLEGMRIIHEKKVDLVFLDINMPDLSGLDFSKAVQNKCKVIFITASDQHALEGFELDAIDYLLKPVPFPRFLRAVQKAKEMLDKTMEPSTAAAHDFIMVQGDNKGKLLKIELDDILYIEGMGNYVSIVCRKQKILSLINLKDLEENLSAGQFVRVHKSFIVSIAHIDSVNGNFILLKHDSKLKIAIGEAYKAPFLHIMKQRLIG